MHNYNILCKISVIKDFILVNKMSMQKLTVVQMTSVSIKLLTNSENTINIVYGVFKQSSTKSKNTINIMQV